MNAVAHRPVKEACADLFFVHIAPDAEILHVHDLHTTRAIESMALQSKLHAAGLTMRVTKEMPPSIVAYWRARNILFLIEVAEESGVINPKRKSQLESMFSRCGAHCEFVTGFQSREALQELEQDETTWGTSHWFAAEPSHMIHYGGTRAAK